MIAEGSKALPLSGDRDKMVANVVDNALRRTASGTHYRRRQRAARQRRRKVDGGDDGAGREAKIANANAFLSASINLTRRVRRLATGSDSAWWRRYAKLRGMAYAAEDDAPGLRVVFDMPD